MRLVLILVALAASVLPIRAEVICGDRIVVLQVFSDAYGPWTITSTHRQQSTTVEVLNAPLTRTWAVMGENYRLQYCITVRQTDGAKERDQSDDLIS